MKKTILLLCLLVPMMANASFLSGAFALLKFSGSTIEINGILCDGSSQYFPELGPVKLTLSNNNNKITIHIDDDGLLSSATKNTSLPKSRCSVSDNSDDYTYFYLINCNNPDIGILYMQDKDDSQPKISIGFRNINKMYVVKPLSIEAYNSEGKPLYDDSTKADCGTIQSWFRYVTSHWKNN